MTATTRTTQRRRILTAERRATAAAMVAMLALAGCGGAEQEPAPQPPTVEEPTTEESATEEPAESDEGGASEGGGASGDGATADPSDPGSHYLFVPLLDAAETLGAEEIGERARDLLEADVALDCPSDLALGERISCTGAEVDGEMLHDVSTEWDAALVPTTNHHTALILRASGEGAGDFPVAPDQAYHVAYLVDQEETPEAIATAMEEGFRATQVSDGPSEVDVTVSCAPGEEVERSAVCEVEGEQPDDAAGTWHGIGHDSFVDGSVVYLFVAGSAQ